MKRREVSNICITIVLTLVTGLICLGLKHMYPFGSNTIDYHDMAQQIAAFYYHVYDFLHQTKPLFYDYYTALGSNQAMSTSGCSNFSLFNLFFLFVKRDMLLESLSIFLLIKMVAMSVSMYVLLSLNKGIGSYAHVILSVGYGFCGFVLTLYMTNQWMDVAFLFPLILVSLKKLVCERKPSLYVIFLSLSLINSYYLSFMILMYIILILGTKLASDRIFKEERKEYHLFTLGIGTALSIGISAFILLPQLIQTLSSSRFNNENGGGLLSKYLSILNTIEPAYTTRWFSLLGLSFAAAVIAIGLIGHRKDIKVLFNVCVPCFIVLLEIFLESTNLIWHFGSYVQYPIRNGFMIYVTVAMCAGYMLSSGSTPDSPKSPIICITVCVIAALLCVLGIKYYTDNPGMEVRKVFHLLAALMVFTFFCYLILLLYKKGAFARYSSILVIAELILYGYIFIGQPTFITGYTEAYEQSGEYIKLCNELSDAFGLEPENIYRMKNPDESLNSNYGLVIRRPVLSNWTHMISPDLQYAAQTWGYTIQYTRLLDAGGTVFSDALIGIRQIITRIPQDEILYTLIDTADIEDAAGDVVTYYLYEPKFILPWVNTVDIDPVIDLKGEDTVSIHNRIFRALGGEGDIAEYVYETKAGTDQVIDLDIAGTRAVYMLGSCVDKEYKNTSVQANGKDILIPSIGEYDNTLYPAYFNCNGLYLGTYADESAVISIQSNADSADEEYTIRIMTLDLDKLKGLCDKLSEEDDITADGNTVRINKYVSGDNKGIMIPLTYDEGFTVTDNGQETGYFKYAGLFSLIPAAEGNNEIIMTFTPKGMKVGAALSAICLLLTVVFIRFASGLPDIINRITRPVFEIVYAGMILIIYLIPVLYALFILLRRFI